MVQTDIDTLRKHWYKLGQEGKKVSGDDAVLFKILDNWQQQELRQEYLKGKEDAATA